MHHSNQFALPIVGGPPLGDECAVPIDNSFPEDEANELARLESYNKHLYRPNTYLHKWWARRSGTIFRHILKQLTADPEKRDFYEPGGLEGKVIFDPMMGGGTILHEAIRLGANVIGVDIDPIPVVQAESTLTISSAAHKETIFKQFFASLSRMLSSLYKRSCRICGAEAETQFILYGLRGACYCKEEALFVDSYILRHERTDNISICPECHEVYAGTEHDCHSTAARPLYEKGTKQCPRCEAEFQDQLDEPFVQRYVPLVVVSVCPTHGQQFDSISRQDEERIAEARSRAMGLDFGDPEAFSVPRGPKSDDLHRRGIASFLDLFTPRQLLYLSAAQSLLRGVSRADRLWLSLLISTSLEFNSLLCGYKGSDIRRPGAVRHVFAHHAYSFPYTALENNPVFSGKTSGTLNRLFSDRIRRAAIWAARPVETRIRADRREKVSIVGEVDGGTLVHGWDSIADHNRRFIVLQADASSLNIPSQSVDFVVTDPPYYDNVQYSDLSTFFRVWLQRFLPTEAEWHYDPLASAVSEGDAPGNQKYRAVLTRIWSVCHKALKRDRGRLIFTFHHWSPDAWAELTLSLKEAGFHLANRYVVFSENPTSVHIKGLKSLKHDTILVLRPSSSRSIQLLWQQPTFIDTSDSYSFCRDAGTALGFLLLSDLDEGAIRTQWRRWLDQNNSSNHTS